MGSHNDHLMYGSRRNHGQRDLTPVIPKVNACDNAANSRVNCLVCFLTCLFWQCNTMYHNVSQCITMYHCVSQCITVYNGVSQCNDDDGVSPPCVIKYSPCITIYHNLSPCITVYRNVSPCITVYHNISQLT